MSRMERLAALDPEARAAVLECLDEISSPMHPREIELALCRAGFTRSKARPIVMILKRLPVVWIGNGSEPQQ